MRLKFYPPDTPPYPPHPTPHPRHPRSQTHSHTSLPLLQLMAAATGNPDPFRPTSPLETPTLSHTITDNYEISGPIGYVESKLIESGKHPASINNLWLDPISNSLCCTLAYHEDQSYGEPIHGFAITPADQTTISAAGWQLFGDPIPLWPTDNSPSHAPLSSSPLRSPSIPRLPAPAYYQPLIKPVQQRATHRTGTLKWIPCAHPPSPKRHPGDPVRLIHPSLLPALRPPPPPYKPSTTPPLAYQWKNAKVKTRAPPWHPNAGSYVLQQFA